MRADWALPAELAFVECQVLRSVESTAVNDGRNDGLFALTFDFEFASFEVERRLNPFQVVFVVHDRGTVDVTRALTPAARVDNEEILQRLVLVKLTREVGEVVTKLHRLIMELTIRPFTQHRDSRSRIAVTIIAITGILKVVEGNDLFRISSIKVGRHTGTEV